MSDQLPGQAEARVGAAAASVPTALNAAAQLAAASAAQTGVSESFDHRRVGIEWMLGCAALALFLATIATADYLGSHPLGLVVVPLYALSFTATVLGTSASRPRTRTRVALVASAFFVLALLPEFGFGGRDWRSLALRLVLAIMLLALGTVAGTRRIRRASVQQSDRPQRFLPSARLWTAATGAFLGALVAMNAADGVWSSTLRSDSFLIALGVAGAIALTARFRLAPIAAWRVWGPIQVVALGLALLALCVTEVLPKVGVGPALGFGVAGALPLVLAGAVPGRTGRA